MKSRIFGSIICIILILPRVSVIADIGSDELPFGVYDPRFTNNTNWMKIDFTAEPVHYSFCPGINFSRMVRYFKR